MGWFSSKPEIKEQQKGELANIKAKALNDEHADILGKMIKLNNGEIIKLLKFIVENDEVQVAFNTINRVEGYFEYLELDRFSNKYGGTKFTHYRFKFIQYINELKRLGLKLESIDGSDF